MNSAANLLAVGEHLRVACYIRVSTTEQANEGYSIGAQTEKLQAYCLAHDWNVVGTYTDPGFSGSNMNRPALTKMLSDINKGRIDVVLVYKLDRLSRSQRDTLYMIEDLFLKHDVDFVSMTENFNTSTPLGKLMIGIMSAFAQLEREQIRERMQIGLDARAKEGYYHGGPYAPIGYEYKNGDLVINEYEAMQVRKIYDLVFSGMPIYSVYKYMVRHGYTHKYGTWRDSSIRSCLSSIIYTGKVTWKGETYDGRHESIIDPETFERMQKLLINRTKQEGFRKNPFQRTTLLGGIIFCGKCGARYYCKQNTSKRPGITPAQRYYTCYSRGKSSKTMIKDPNCKNKSWNIKDLDKLILDEIRRLATDPEYMNNIIKDNEPDNSVNNRQIIMERIESIDKQITKLVDLYQVGGIDFDVINRKISALNEEKASLEADLDENNTPEPELSVNEANDLLFTFSEVVDTAEPDVLRDIVHGLIDGIIINGDDIDIHWKFV